MHQCNIVDNAEYGLYTSSCNDPSTVIDATNSWWGVENAASIELLVHHQADNPNCPIVEYDPFAVDSFNIVFATPEYYCGDANSDGGVNIGDAVCLLNYVFRPSECDINPPIGCPPDNLEAGDVNYDGNINIGDVIYLNNFVFNPVQCDINPPIGCPPDCGTKK